MTTPSDLATVAMHIQLAAHAAGVTDVRMMSVGRPCDLEPLANRVSALLAAADEGNVVRILPLHSDTYSRQTDSTNTGLIVVTPSRLGRNDVEDVSNLLSISGWRFLGILPYRPPGIVNRIMGADRQPTPTTPDRRHDASVSGVRPAFAEAAADAGAVEPNGDGESRIAALGWRLEHPAHKQRG